MQLNYNNWLARLYRWFYNIHLETRAQLATTYHYSKHPEEIESRIAKEVMPKSLCPYFWKLVIMWILLIPYSILSLPVILFPKFYKNLDELRWIQGIITYLLSVVALGCLFSMFALPLSYLWLHLGVLNNLTMLGFIMGWSVTVGIIITYTLTYIKENTTWFDFKYKEPKEVKLKQPSVVTEFIKASYNKYCPRIDWR